MKKRTKKKLLKFLGKMLKGLFRLVVLYPAKGAWYIAKCIAKGVCYLAKGAWHLGYSGIRSLKGRGEKGKKGIKEKWKGRKHGRIKVAPLYDALNEVRRKRGSLSLFERKLLANKSSIGIILGARGSGKSAIGVRLLENFKAETGKKIYALGFKAETLPEWITVIDDINAIGNNSMILIDEGGIEFSSRRAMSSANKLLSDLLLISRHRDLSVLFISQNSSNLEINAIRQTDYLILKPSSLLQKDFERKKIKDIYAGVDDDFKELKGRVGLTFIYSDEYQGFVTNSLPGFWSEKISKGYNKIQTIPKERSKRD